MLKEVAAGIGSNLCGVSSTSMGSKEINYVMRQLGPAICRDPQLLKKVAQKQLRISLQNGKGKTDNFSRMYSHHNSIFSIPLKSLMKNVYIISLLKPDLLFIFLQTCL